MTREGLHKLVMFAVMLVLPGLVQAEREYTYIKASLGYPWFMFFVFLALIAIPFVLIIMLSWRSKNRESTRLAPREF